MEEYSFTFVVNQFYQVHVMKFDLLNLQKLTSLKSRLLIMLIGSGVKIKNL